MKFGFGAKDAGAAGGKLEQIKAQLQKVQGAAPAANNTANMKVGGGETIADDGGIPADKMNQIQAQIASDEALVRDVLALTGGDYDALVRMDGESVYSRAVQANPEILKQVMASERPVLAALKVAMGYKPVAEFVGKYGSSPAEIKAAMRAEIEAEMAAKESGVAKVGGPVFSGTRASAPAAATRKLGKLVDVFGK